MIRGFEVAEALEGMACYLIAERVHNGELTSADFAELEACAKELNHYLEAGLLKKWTTADADFHAMLAELCGNHYIVQQRNRITDQINQVLWFVTPFDIDKQVSNQEHMQMLDILQRGDAEAARTIGQLHRHRVRNVLKVIL